MNLNYNRLTRAAVLVMELDIVRLAAQCSVVLVVLLGENEGHSQHQLLTQWYLRLHTTFKVGALVLEVHGDELVLSCIHAFGFSTPVYSAQAGFRV